MKKKGFALFATIGAITLCLLLIGAFLQTNRSFFAMSRLDDDRQACHETLKSASQYLKYILEDQRGWGFGNWKGLQEVDISPTRVLFSLAKYETGDPAVKKKGQGLIGYRHLIGTSPETGVDLHIAFSNNLNNEDSQEFDVHDPNGRKLKQTVLEKSCLVQMSARRGAGTERAELLLRRAAFIDSTLVSSRDIDIQVYNDGDPYHAVVFNSKDKVRNQIRSEGDIKLPVRGMLDFRRKESNPPPIKGTIWSKKDVYIGDSDKDADIRKAVKEHSIEVVKDAKNHYDIPELEPEDFEGRDLSKPGVSHLTPKRYIFTQARVTYERPDGSSNTLEMRVLKEVSVDEGQEQPVVEKFHYNRNEINAVDGTVRILPGRGERGYVPPELRGTPENGNDFTVDGDIKVEMRGENFDEFSSTVVDRRDSEPRIVLPENSTVSGAFIIEADDHHLVPTITFGEGEANGGLISAEGEVKFEGYINGGGKIVSRNGSVKLYPNDVDVESNKTAELAIYAKHDVSIKPPNNEDADDSDDNSQDDTSDRTTKEEREDVRDFQFTGLIYAGDNFTFETTEGYSRRLLVQGAVVAKNGGIYMNSRRGVVLTYDPEYLDQLLEKSTINRPVQIEELSWRPI